MNPRTQVESKHRIARRVFHGNSSDTNRAGLLFMRFECSPSNQFGVLQAYGKSHLSEAVDTKRT